MSLFITGTDTGVGKTVITAALAALLRADGRSVCVYKPVQTGSPPDAPEDPAQVRDWLGDPTFPVFCSYCFEAPAAPRVADIDQAICWERLLDDFVALKRRYEVVLVEGAGGVRVPLTPEREMIDLMRLYSLPVLLVARPNLGTINQTLLSLEALSRRQINVHGVLVSNYPDSPADVAVQSLPGLFEELLPTRFWGTVSELPLQAGGLAEVSSLSDSLAPVRALWEEL